MNADSPTPSDRKAIWVFTPSRTDPKDLEFIFVQREDLLKDAVERVRESALSNNKHHLLFVGPRGCGKTHLVTRIVSRLSADNALKDRLRIAWLNEDETCTTLLEFLLKIYAALEKRYPQLYPSDALAPVYEMKQDAAQEFVAQQLLSSLGTATLLVVAENLDSIFEGLGEAGQKQLRAFIQENSKLSIVATAQRLVEELSRRTGPFFGFFQTEHLKPLDVNGARELLQKMARLQGKTELAKFLTTSRGRSSVLALHHLSGGNHRIYIVLSQFITLDSIEALLGPFLKMVDELTPYYQERIRWLAPLQRKIVEYLCSCEGTAPVKEIAKRLFTTPQTISSQLQDLREKGYVEANQRGRESLYEISEPLMRICVEVKENQSYQPLRLLVDFLRVWYDDNQLRQYLGLIENGAESRAYLQSALERNGTEGNLRKQLLIDDIQSSPGYEMLPASRRGLLRECESLPEAAVLAISCWANGNSAEALRCFDEGIAGESSASGKAGLLLRRGSLHSNLGDQRRAKEDYTMLIGLSGATVEQVAKALLNRGVIRSETGDTPGALEDYRTLMGLSGAPVEPVAAALLNRAVIYGQAGDTQRALEDYTRLIGLSGAPVEPVAAAILNRGAIYGQAGDRRRAQEDFTMLITLSDAPVDQVAKALFNRGITYVQAGNIQSALEDYTNLIGLSGAPVQLVAEALLNRCISCGRAGDTQRALEDYTTLIGLPGAPIDQVAKALFNRGIVYGQAGDKKSALEDYTTLIGLPGAPVEHIARALFNRGNTFALAGDTHRALEDYTTLISLPNAPVDQVARALFNRGTAFGRAGDTQSALGDFTKLIGLPGAQVDQVAKALFNRGVAYRQAGDGQRSLDDYTTLIGLPDAPVPTVSIGLFTRGAALLKGGQRQEARFDFQALIELPNAPVKNVVDAYLSLCELHFEDGRWSEGFNALEAGMQRGSQEQPPYHGNATDLTGVLFSAGMRSDIRRAKVATLLNIYASHSALSVLGEAVVQHLGNLFRSGPSRPFVDALELWARTWEQASETFPDFRLSMRLLRTATDFVKTGGKDPTILLDLASPERVILQQAFGLSEMDMARRR
jgi:tetratricopeptide (TPR) repeat protein